jgi:glycosyltransferase involved in cell wall biosynthesis
MENNFPTFSILMVTYNSEKYVQKAIQSVLNSSFVNFELIISDDCSTDSTETIINEFKDHRIKFFKQTINLGEYQNRNFCILKATGKYSLFIDGDDLIYPHGLEVMFHYTNRLPTCGMYLMRWYKRNIFYPVAINPDSFLKAVIFNYGFNDIAFSNTLFNTEILKEEGPLPTKYKSGDSYIRLKIGTKHKTGLISDGLTWWRETPNQASSRPIKNFNNLIEEIIMAQEFYWKNLSWFSSNEKKRALENFKLAAVKQSIQYIKSREFMVALKLILHFKLSIITVLNYRKQFYEIDIFQDYDPSNPACHKI